ncbi:MAG: hypothetical protein IT365_02315 [Candidatus Hydrogenedentes bacterium]|nr:hypothetical protein [Candidatus Hydrogenedentota bacterium]
MTRNAFVCAVLVAGAVLLCPFTQVASFAEPAQSAPAAKPLAADRLPAFAKAFEANAITGQDSGGKRFATVRRKSVDTFSLLESLGFSNQDIIRLVNGVPAGGKEAVVAQIKNARPGSALSFTIDRAGVSHTLRFQIEGVPGTSAGPKTGSPKGDTLVVKEDALEKEWGDQDPWLLLVMAAPEMVSDTRGNVVGVRSQAFGDIGVTRMLGLKNGDIIQSVNGYPVNSEQAIFDLVNRLDGERNFTAKLLRGGRPMTLKYRLE